MHKNFLVGLKFGEVGCRDFFFKITKGRTIFNFSCKTSGFWGGFSFFWSIFCQFCGIFSCKISAFCGAGWSFWVKNYIFFHAKLKLLKGWVVFLSKKMTIFLRFFIRKLKFWLKVPSLARSAPKPLKVHSLARSVQKPLKVPSLARSVPKPLKVGQAQACECAKPAQRSSLVH